MYSSILAKYYDLLMGDYTQFTKIINTLTSTYLPEQAHVLELGCGTGTILKELESKYAVSGLDNSPNMLDLAREKVPGATYYQADLNSFKLQEKYDGIICVYDTINHLLARKQWSALFKRVHNHLVDNGIFIFDINTLSRVERMIHAPMYVGKIDKSTILCAKVIRSGRKKYAAQFQIIENIYKDKLNYHEEIVPEITFGDSEVQDMLKNYFTLLKTVDLEGNQPTKLSGIFYVCKKR